jgi:hypothetical protein
MGCFAHPAAAKSSPNPRLRRRHLGDGLCRIGTVGAVAYALFRDLFVVPRRRPKLDLRFEHAGNDQVVATAGGFDAACVRLRVANGAGKDTADDVVVMVTEVRWLEDSERAIAQTKPIGLPLTWSGSNPPLTVASCIPAPSATSTSSTSTGPPAMRSTSRESAQKPCHFSSTSLRSQRAARRSWSGTYEISVEVRARNADATRYAIPVYWDGKWSGKAAMWEHLRVEPPRKGR